MASNSPLLSGVYNHVQGSVALTSIIL